jgi:hypothetical protein
MKKYIIVFCTLLLNWIGLSAQSNYPIPEYSNEIYLIKKDSTISLVRLEKGFSNQEMKVKLMGMGGVNQEYSTDGEKSTVTIPKSTNLLFLFYTGNPSSESTPRSPGADSMMNANGMDMSALSTTMSGMIDPTQMISLYNMKSEKGKRKIRSQSMGIMGSSKGTATKFSLSIKKIKENYYEMKVDKILPSGQYSFVMADMGGMGQSYVLYSFAIE